MVSFVEKGKTDAIVNGTVIKDVEIETEVTIKNLKTIRPQKTMLTTLTQTQNKKTYLEALI